MADDGPFGVRSIADGLRRWPDARLVDLRDGERFARGHAAGAGRVAVSEFVERRMELPGRAESVLLLHDEPEAAREGAERLAERGFARVAWLAVPLASDPAGMESNEPAVRLWSPSPFLERVRGELPPGRALDLACGTGRATVYLAQEGWTVEGWDVDASALSRARAFAARERADVTFHERDLESAPPPESPGAFALIVVLRYLHRELFPWIERSLAPGGALVYETFRQGQERFGHPRRARFLLEPGELLRSFPTLRVEFHEETPDTVPPVLSRLLARRPD